MKINIKPNKSLYINLPTILTSDWNFTGRLKYIKVDEVKIVGNIKMGTQTHINPETVEIFVEILVSRFFGLFGYTKEWIDIDTISIYESTTI